MLVNEIFSSIEGEGIRTGYPVTFIRLFGCNIHCSYCDTRYSCVGTDFKKMSIDEIVEKVAQFGNKRVTLTGGEPLIHRDVDSLITTLWKLGYEINIETNGTVFVGEYTHLDNVILTVDYKSLSSGQNNKMDFANFQVLREQDVLKFVVATKEDLEDMKQVVTIYNPNCNIFVSPVFGDIEPVQIVDFIKENNLQNCRVQLQLHKFIWPVNMRGV